MILTYLIGGLSPPFHVDVIFILEHTVRRQRHPVEKKVATIFIPTIKSTAGQNIKGARNERGSFDMVKNHDFFVKCSK